MLEGIFLEKEGLSYPGNSEAPEGLHSSHCSASAEKHPPSNQCHLSCTRALWAACMHLPRLPLLDAAAQDVPFSGPRPSSSSWETAGKNRKGQRETCQLSLLFLGPQRGATADLLPSEESGRGGLQVKTGLWNQTSC